MKRPPLVIVSCYLIPVYSEFIVSFEMSMFVMALKGGVEEGKQLIVIPYAWKVGKEGQHTLYIFTI